MRPRPYPRPCEGWGNRRTGPPNGALSQIAVDVRIYGLYISTCLTQPLPPRRGEVGSGVSASSV